MSRSDFDAGVSHPYELTDRDRLVIDIERGPYRSLAQKEQAVYDTFGHSLVRHNLLFNTLLDIPAAHDYAPAFMGARHRAKTERIAKRQARDAVIQNAMRNQ